MKTKEEAFKEFKKNCDAAILAIYHTYIAEDMEEDYEAMQKMVSCISDSVEAYEKCPD